MPDGAVVSQVQLMLPAALSEAPPLMVRQRSEVMKQISEIIYEKNVKSIGTEMDYKTKIAGPSASGYASVLDPSFESRSGLTRAQVVRRQAKKSMEAYEKFRDNLAHMFETVDGEVNKRYREAVDAKSEAFSKGMGKILAITGAAAELGKGLVGIAVFWMSGDRTTQRHLRGDDKIIAGGPLNISISAPAFKAALTQRLIQSARILIEADWNPDDVTLENDKNNLIIKGMQKDIYAEFATGGASHCDWITVDGRQYLEIKVSTV
jgi:hypothetical protein